MSGVGDEEIERLANRLAMLVSDDGEADNAGRAVGALARRLGLSGGQLKAIFVAGAESAGAERARLATQRRQISSLEAEIAALRDTLRLTEATARGAMTERDALRKEAESLHVRLSRRRRGRLAALAVAVVLVAGAAAGVQYGPRLKGLFGPAPVLMGTPTYQSAVVRDGDAILRGDPDETSPAIDRLPVGTHMTVRRVFWHNLIQWVEVEYGGHAGYILSTSVDLS